MTLHDWLEKKKITRGQFAKMLSVSVQTVYNWLSGRKKPTKHFIQIKEITNGEVQPDSFY